MNRKRKGKRKLLTKNFEQKLRLRFYIGGERKLVSIKLVANQKMPEKKSYGEG